MGTDAFQPVQGMSDFEAPEVCLWRALEASAREVFERYGYEDLRTLVVEPLGIYLHSLGETSDVVTKEMYNFEDRGGRRLALRPEGTAGVIRCLAGKGAEGLQARVYYLGPMFRCERTQKGRKRQFHQAGVEATGAPNPRVDAECIALQVALLEAMGLKGARVRLNTQGAPDERKTVADGLRAALEPVREQLCEDCARRIDRNVLRVLDCKQEACRKIVEKIPAPVTFMREESRTYFEKVRTTLEALGLDAEQDAKLVRGLDYYAHTVWELTHDALGAQNALAGGGRYEITFEGKTVPGVGFAVGMERVIDALRAEGVRDEDRAPSGGVWLVSLGESALDANMELACRLRRAGIRCGMELEPKSMKAQMRKAGRWRAAHAVIRGEDELRDGTAVIKDLSTGEQRTVKDEDVCLREILECET